LAFRESMRVRMIPVESGRLIGGDAEAVFKGGVARLDEGADHFVLMAGGRQIESMEMQVGRGGGDGATAAARGGLRVHVGTGGIAFGQVVLEGEDDFVAGADAEGWAEDGIRVDVAIERVAVDVLALAKGEVDMECAVDTAEVGGLADGGAGHGSGAGRLLGECRRSQQKNHGKTHKLRRLAEADDDGMTELDACVRRDRAVRVENKRVTG